MVYMCVDRGVNSPVYAVGIPVRDWGWHLRAKMKGAGISSSSLHCDVLEQTKKKKNNFEIWKVFKNLKKKKLEIWKK